MTHGIHDPARAADIAAAHAAGEKRKSIAARYGISHRHVDYILWQHRNGISRRTGRPLFVPTPKDRPCVTCGTIFHAATVHSKRCAKCCSGAPQHPELLIVEMRRLWDMGLSTAAIAAALEHLDAGITKNAVVGVARRNDFPPRPSPIRRAA